MIDRPFYPSIMHTAHGSLAGSARVIAICFLYPETSKCMHDVYFYSFAYYFYSAPSMIVNMIQHIAIISARMESVGNRSAHISVSLFLSLSLYIYTYTLHVLQGTLAACLSLTPAQKMRCAVILSAIIRRFGNPDARKDKQHRWNLENAAGNLWLCKRLDFT